MVARTDYAGHDRVYRKRRAAGAHGWCSPAVVDGNFHRLLPLLEQRASADHTVLELGCGSGELTDRFVSLFGSIVGVDIAPTAIDWARERVPQGSFICASLLETDLFARAAFDLVIDANCLHCIIGVDRAVWLDNVRRWVRPGGLLLLHTMCNEPTGDLCDGYCSRDGVIYRQGIATRYLGPAEDILQEVAAAGFLCLQHQVVPQADGPDMLVSLHQADDTVEPWGR